MERRRRMSDRRSCDNCGDRKCYEYIQANPEMVNPELNLTTPCDYWQKFPCPFCGGALSEIRLHDGKKYRHCYSCHFDFYFTEETINDR